MAVKLEPCPKCGSVNILHHEAVYPPNIRRELGIKNEYWLVCGDCGWGEFVDSTKKKAIEAWNEMAKRRQEC